MVYRPRVFTVGTSAAEAVNYDKDRTSLTITNLSGATIYWGVDPSVGSSGTLQGAPIFNNGRLSCTFLEGRDPRIARFLISAGSGTVIIDEERAHDPLLSAITNLSRAVSGLISKLGV